MRDLCVGDHGCKVELDQEAICLACDAPSMFSGASDVRPDFIIATLADARTVLWIVIEMTTGGQGAKDASEVRDQLQAGAAKITYDQALNLPNSELLPVVMRRKDKKVAALQRLGSPEHEVRYGRKKLPIRIRLCGDTLTKILTPTRSERVKGRAS